ncbi:class I SAM-dependent methyltransferase [Nocardia seriolae]|uniref:Cyclopropane-fatty-acyl-phospholipid synthase n=1 Tax=Nocardia seriolae TaxID=37332 RepID=A0ABC8AUE3_9NOCA|nr:class I SAM-dependent methyltransferase [Nocardia seriolae]APA97664.1 Cyclopropane-fatty-acyl-phospholipid synthase [Nocardia seriolae]OJF81415.1 SAM-dependent methyltransferase [Nocardia seriolae]PSK27358.1 class I SAM-dependent methyltransferase [Nocardia seriolae]QOW34581.1 class I SAM-dependent methyltransferase [Nocardia seriolae]QUN17957.1 class I SAM-dependent methyltransferase [Nocardia seriolae]
MTDIVNTAQPEAWNGYEGEHWAGNYDRYDAVNHGFNEPLLTAARITDGDRVLDIGCGNGQLTRAATRRAGNGTATGLDLSGPMLARARGLAAAEGVPNVTFEQGDAQVYPFPAGTFDAALSRFGIMFFTDPTAAFANIARALRPGGRLAFAAMPPMPGTDLGAVFGAAAAHLDNFVVSPAQGPFADPDRTRTLLSTAGFTDIAVEYREAEGIWGRDIADATEFIMGWGPVHYHRALAGFATDAEVRQAVSATLAPHLAPDGVRLRVAAWLVTATTPLP